MDLADGDAVYFRMREEQELGRADEAADDKVRTVHLALAAKYRSLVAEAERRTTIGIEDGRS